MGFPQRSPLLVWVLRRLRGGHNYRYAPMKVFGFWLFKNAPFIATPGSDIELYL